MQDHPTESSQPPQDIPDPCASETIRTPGSIQPHGVLFVLDPELVIVQVSENCGRLLGRDASSVTGARVLDLVTPECAAKVEMLVREAASTFVNPFRVLIIVGHQPRSFDGIAHALGDDRFILELEPVTDGPDDGLESYLDVVQRSLTLVADETDLSRFAGVMAREIKRFTGFDRVMVYRFAPQGHGQVIAEAREEEMGSYLGLHYPASDIPAQARELYLTNLVRLLQDVDAIPARLVPEGQPCGSGVTDLGKAVLRAMSPTHLQYLRNMGVSASFSISLIVRKRLWGLIACHHRSPRFIPYAVRATASLYGTVMAAQLDLFQQGQATMRMAVVRKSALSVLTTARDLEDPVESLRLMLPKLKELFAADGAILLAGGKSCGDGATPGEATCVALMKELSALPTHDTVITHSAGEIFPSLAGLASMGAGMVAVSLGDFGWLVMLRGESARKIEWAGHPDEAKIPDDAGRLTPRTSFAIWTQEVEGESEPWPDETATLAAEIRVALLEIVQRRNQRLLRSNEDLRKFAGVVAHEVKNNLQTSIMALSLIQESAQDSLDPLLREMALHGSARLSGLAKFVDDLLSFSGTDAEARSERIDLGATVREIFKELSDAGLGLSASLRAEALPVVVGHPTQLRHVLTNLLRNALIHGRAGERPITVVVGHRKDGPSDVIFVRDDGRGIAAEQRSRVFEYFYRGDSASAGSGIGLAFCAQALERMNQRIWVEESVPTGSTFCFTVRTVH